MGGNLSARRPFLEPARSLQGTPGDPDRRLTIAFDEQTSVGISPHA